MVICKLYSVMVPVLFILHIFILVMLGLQHYRRHCRVVQATVFPMFTYLAGSKDCGGFDDQGHFTAFDQSKTTPHHPVRPLQRPSYVVCIRGTDKGFCLLYVGSRPGEIT